MNSRYYSFVRAITRPFMAVFFPFTVAGIEKIPAEGAVLLCSNHVSALDPILLICAARRQLRFIGKKELFKTRIGKWFFSNMGVVPVDRGASDLQAMRACLSVLSNEGVLGIFPQGHRYPQDDRREIQTGAAMMALRSKAAVVTIHISRPAKPFRRTYIKVCDPLDLSSVSSTNSLVLQEVTRRITGSIWQEKTNEQ